MRGAKVNAASATAATVTLLTTVARVIVPPNGDCCESVPL